MKYALFAGEQYYPAGGIEDFKGFFDTAQDAIDFAQRCDLFDWWHVVNPETFEVVTDNRRSRLGEWVSSDRELADAFSEMLQLGGSAK